MNWKWEYRLSPQWIFLTRLEDNRFCFHRTTRTAAGLETCRNYDVVPDTPLYDWISRQEWPVSPQGLSTSLDVREVAPLPRAWLKSRGISRHKHYRAQDLRRLYSANGFSQVEVFAYGQTYDTAAEAGLLQDMLPFQSQLAIAEARLALKLRSGSGPWLFCMARK